MIVVNAVSENFVMPRVHYTIKDYNLLTPHGRFVVLCNFIKKMRNRYFSAEGQMTTLELVANSAAVYFQCKCNDMAEERSSLYKNWMSQVSLKISYEPDLFEIMSSIMMGSMNIDEITEEEMNHIYFIFKNEFDKYVRNYEKENNSSSLHNFSDIFKSIFS